MKKLLTILLISFSVATQAQVLPGDTLVNKADVKAAINAALSNVPSSTVDLAPVYAYIDSLIKIVNGNIESITYTTKTTTSTANLNTDTISLATANTVVCYDVTVSARNTANQDIGTGLYKLFVQNKSGVLTVVPFIVKPFAGAGTLSSARFTFVTSGTNVFLRANGIAGNVEWKTSYTKQL